ncbi:hypothetical protein [Faucicola boevrei]|uniref:hypothetical protein n=1 Tax=Faucicola boevrei TaxID=346665 RepID=UPI000375A633|nr:hypothetical protein [Moraxella boevrei]
MKKNSQKDKYTLDKKREILASNIRQLKVRKFPFDDLNSIAKKAGLSSSVGSEAVAQKIEKLEGKDASKIITGMFEKIENLLEYNTALASKRIYLYEVPIDELKEIKNLFDTHSLFNSKFKLGDESLFDYSLPNNNDRYSSKIYKASDTLFLYYIKGFRSYVEKVHSPSLMAKAQNIEDDGEVIDVLKVVKHNVTIFDFVAIDLKNNCLIYGLDLDNGKFIKAELDKAYGKISDIFKNSFSKFNLKPINLRPCIAKMEKELNGKVTKHGFATDDGSYSYTGGSSTQKLDARQDKFYDEGIKNVSPDYFGIRKIYSLENKDNPIIAIEMGYREYRSSATSEIRYAILYNLTKFESLQFCIDKIISFK